MLLSLKRGISGIGRAVQPVTLLIPPSIIHDMKEAYGKLPRAKASAWGSVFMQAIQLPRGSLPSRPAWINRIYSCTE